MEDSLLTKCPHCKTLFRISYEHLSVAEGQVRCGVCFKVFSAPDEGLSYSEGAGSDRNTTFGHTDQTTPLQESGEPGAAAPATSGLAEPEPDHAHIPEVAAVVSPAAALAPEGDVPEEHHVAQLHIIDEPLEELLLGQPQAPGGRPVLWGALGIAALILLGLQWAWFNMDRYAHTQQWHAWYKLACSTLRCTLPEYRDLEQLSTERLEVRSHPDYRNALIVDMIVSNAGHERQPLPTLTLEFYDLNGATLARRSFAPDDYLANLDNPIDSLPVRSPVHFSFAIIDPGAQAVNYAVQLQETVN